MDLAGLIRQFEYNLSVDLRESSTTLDAPKLDSSYRATMSGRFPSVAWILLLVLVAGCRGCTPGTNKVASDKENEKKTKRIDRDEMRAIPYATETIGMFLKPGHWYQANQKLTANEQDESLAASLMIYDRDRKPVPLYPGYAPVDFQRSLSLARGQSKNIRLMFYQPDVPMNNEGEIDTTSTSTPSYLGIEYTERRSGLPVYLEEFPSRLLNGYQYNLITLSADPARYMFWRGLPCMFWPSLARLTNERFAPHKVYDLNQDEIAGQFPSRFFAMTSISHVVINDASPAIFSREQQDALLDWLYFGGTIVINGPDASGGVYASFLKDYAPVQNASTVDWTDQDSEKLKTKWTIKREGDPLVPFQADKTLSKLSGTLAPSCSWIPSLEGLVAERLVGQGRVVMTTFPMSDSSFVRWPSYDSLIHNAILRKPSRTLTPRPDIDTLYAGAYQGTEMNPLHSTRLRIWARDLDVSMMTNPKPDAPAIDQSARFPSPKKTSLGAWNPDSEVVLAARNGLQEASGITVPRLATVIKLLVGYLVVLVPLNWLVFRLFGRVEFAWVAAPIISIIGAFVVARSVQLDVGFSRSQQTYGFLEIHAGHPRGVLSSYTALYTSLTTNYKAHYEDDVGVVTPIPPPKSDVSISRRILTSKVPYTYADSEGNGLQNHSVLSNTTGLLQAEEVVDLGGGFQSEFDDSGKPNRWTNGTAVPLSDLGVLRLNLKGELQVGWVGNLVAGASAEIEWLQEAKPDRWHPNWDNNPLLKKPDLLRADGTKWHENKALDDLYLGSLLELLAEQYPLGRGECIGLGWTNQDNSRLTISPATTQTRKMTLVLVHAKAAELLTAPEPDSEIFPRIEDETAVP